MLALSLSAAAKQVERVLAIGCHADDIEIGCGGTLLALTRRSPALHVTWVVIAASGSRAEEARASANAFLADATDTDIRVLGFRESFLPYIGGEVKEAFETLQGRRARSHPHAHSPRSPSRPPARLRAHLEHVPRSPDPRIRNPEVRRRHRRAERLRPARRRARRCKNRDDPAALPEPGWETLVRRRAPSCVDAAPRHGMRDPLRRGVHVSKAFPHPWMIAPLEPVSCGF